MMGSNRRMGARAGMSVVTISYFRFGSLRARLWAFAQMGLSRRALSDTPDIGFWKLFGTGSGQGFTLAPNTGLYAILATWPDLATARRRTAQSRAFARYRKRADETYTVFLTPVDSRGKWDGRSRFLPDARPETFPSPIAALTRATIKPARSLKFWKHAPSVSDTIGTNPDVLFKAGMGEVPGFQQVTFSIWPDVKSMSRFAYRSAAHAGAIRAVREGLLFREELYARFAVLGTDGTWLGGDPVAAHLVSKAAGSASAPDRISQGA